MVLLCAAAHRPLEVEGHADGLALADGVGVRADDLGDRGPVGARRLGVDDVLRVLEADAEKDLALVRLVVAAPTHTLRAGEGVDLQLEHPRGEDLEEEEEEGRDGSEPPRPACICDPEALRRVKESTSDHPEGEGVRGGGLNGTF